MINNEVLASKIDNLPEDLKKEVLDFMEYLIIKHKDRIQKKITKHLNSEAARAYLLFPMILTNHWRISRSICDEYSARYSCLYVVCKR